ncbi:MAG: hypothetical protein BroJett031_03060 [Betaproteobacteria bacterium]|nr:MAG: hypothetical protein BroJett031_03060 [Betaproteobacteria bacterium]
MPEHIEPARSTEEGKQSQLKRLQDFHQRHASQAPAMLERLKRTVIDNGNVFAVLMDALRCCSLGQITSALFEVGAVPEEYVVCRRPSFDLHPLHFSCCSDFFGHYCQMVRGVDCDPRRRIT